MINKIQLIRNVGQFDSASGAANISLSRLTVVYAENARGKTTLAAVLRSLATGDPIPITERRRLAAQHPPHVVLDCAGGPPSAMFQNNAWNRTLPNMVVFDDVFVDQNVYSGLAVGTEHRQNLHELILGAQGVTLIQQLQRLVSQIETHNAALRTKGAAIPSEGRGTLTIDEFCVLLARADIDEAIQIAERLLAAANEQDAVRNTSAFSTFSLPAIEISEADRVLQLDLPALDASAAARVQDHFSRIGREAEAWIADGMRRISQTGNIDSSGACPFCAQNLSGSALISHYRAYFSDAYRDLKRAVAEALITLNRTHSGEVAANFERAVRIAGELRQFWTRFCNVPDVTLDTATIVRDWRSASEAVAAALTEKQTAPLERIMLVDEARAAVAAYEIHRQVIIALNQQLQQANAAIRLVKEQAAAGNPRTLASEVARLKAVKARHTPTTSALCVEYLAEKDAKTNTERLRDQAKAALDQYRTNAFPRYQAAINVYLERFNADFRIDSVCPVNTRGGPTCAYNVIINNIPIPVSGSLPGQGEPSFRNTLSSGDRNTLALAFFFTSLDQDLGLADKVVVIDDPVSSLDEHRSLTTVQEIRRLAQRVSQVIVLSHSKSFLCRIWEGADRTIRTALQVIRDGTGSNILSWNVDEDSITEHDRRHAALRSYLTTGTPNSREVAHSIRPLLEAFLRVSYPANFTPGTLLGPFRALCKQRVGTPQQILNAPDTQELRDIIEYANRFHHDTNPAWETEVINDGELRGFVNRALNFTRR